MKRAIVRLRPLFLSFLFWGLGCTRNPSALLDPAGPHALLTANLFWFFFWVEAAAGVLVLAVLFYAVFRRRRANSSPPDPSLDPATEYRLKVAVTSAVLITIVILSTFVVMSFLVDRRLMSLDQNPDLEIEVTAHQWWWELRYLNKEPQKVFITANEIHVPVNKTVRFILKSSDVIHSLWFPNLSGKKDIIPGRDNDMFIRAEQAGTWAGRCGEFCGLQHAHMELALVAQNESDFEAWQEAQRLPAAEPASSEEIRGRQIFATGACVVCHSIRTADHGAHSSNAPDLTHLKSRATIGAGAVPNTKGYLGGWIIDPQGIKPGVHMPTILQDSKDFQALLSYLEILK